MHSSILVNFVYYAGKSLIQDFDVQSYDFVNSTSVRIHATWKINAREQFFGSGTMSCLRSSIPSTITEIPDVLTLFLDVQRPSGCHFEGVRQS